MDISDKARQLREADQRVVETRADWDAAKREADAAQVRHNEAVEAADKAARALLNSASPERENGRR